MNPTQTEKENRIETADKPAERFAHTNQEKKRSENRRRASQYMKDLNRRNAIGDMLYMVGFWVEYVGVCVRRKVSTVVRGIADTVLNLLLIVLRPILIGLITLIEDIIKLSKLDEESVELENPHEARESAIAAIRRMDTVFVFMIIDSSFCIFTYEAPDVHLFVFRFLLTGSE